jgi:hypothetical protein
MQLLKVAEDSSEVSFCSELITEFCFNNIDNKVPIFDERSLRSTIKSTNPVF